MVGRLERVALTPHNCSVLNILACKGVQSPVSAQQPEHSLS